LQINNEIPKVKQICLFAMDKLSIRHLDRMCNKLHIDIQTAFDELWLFFHLIN